VGSAAGLSEALAKRSTELTEAVTNAVAVHVAPSSAWVAAEHLRPEGASIRARLVERVLSLAATSEPLSAEDLHFYEYMGASFASHDVPLQALTAAFDVGTAAITGAAWRIAPTGHFAEMVKFTDCLARMMEQAQEVAIRAYLEGDLRPTHRMLAEALIAGEPVTSVAAATGERLASNYLVMACMAAPPAQADALRSPAISRAIESIPGTLHCDDESKLVILFPWEASWREASSLAAELDVRLRALVGHPIYTAQAYQPSLATVPASVEEAYRVLSLAMATPDGDSQLYGIDGLLVELAILRQPDIRRRLTSLLEPLSGGADLLRTLEVLLACNLDRERAAKELCIHRRTLRYRVDRIRELSGIDPDAVRGLHLLRAALTALRMSAMEASQQRRQPSSWPAPLEPDDDGQPELGAPSIGWAVS